MGAIKTKSRKLKSANFLMDAEDEGDSVDLSPAMSVDDDEYSEKNDSEAENYESKPMQTAREHMKQLQRLEDKDPEFYQFLKEYDKELLDFDDEGIDEDEATDADELATQDELESHASVNKVKEEPVKVITMEMVDSWCNSVQKKVSIAPVRSLLRAFRTACHYGDESETEPSEKFRIMSNSVFNKIMLFVLSEMDSILRNLLKLPDSGGKKDTIISLERTKAWKSYGSLVKSYLGNSLHLLSQMTDSQMISFTLRRLRCSAVFLVAYPSLLRRYIKVALHFWGTGGGALPVVSFLFLRDLCVRVGSDCLDSCLKGIYKTYVLNCRFVNSSKLQHIQFLGNCVIELYGIDLSSAYQHAFVFIRQMAMILRDALATKTKEAFGKVYEWKYMNCLELWTGMICAYRSEADLQPLAYPLTQIISGVARLNPTARYFPLRLRCAEMLNRLAAATCTYIPVSMLLLDMLEMKELNMPPTAGFGKAIDLHSILKVNKETSKTRAFQEACIFSVAEQLAEHLAQWSYSVAFFELSFIPLVRLRSFCKSTKVKRFRREMKELISQVEANCDFTNKKRLEITFAPNDLAAEAFLKDEKESKASPLSQYVASLVVRARERTDSMVESSVIIGADSSRFGSKVSEIEEKAGNEEGAAIFSSSWLPGSDSKCKDKVKKAKKSKQMQKQDHDLGPDEDLVEDLVLSSDDDGEPLNDSPSIEDGGLDAMSGPLKKGGKKRKRYASSSSQEKRKPRSRKAGKKSRNG